MGVYKFFGSVILGLTGSYLLYRGWRTSSPRMMLWGGALILLSCFL